MDMVAEIRRAAERIAPLVRRTPVEASAWLSAETGAAVHLKLECWQRTGSFKLRGAANFLLTLPADRRARGAVGASTGNHGAALAHAGAALGCPITVYAPATADPAKLEAMRRRGAAVELAGADCVEAEAAARAHAAARDLPYVSPYNDPAVVAGQGTVGLELAEQLPGLDAVLVAVGGGGLIAGAAAALKAARPEIRVIGCSPANSAVMHASVQAGRILDLPSAPTLSDGTAGGLEPGAITFPLCQTLVDDWIEVPEAAIAAALRDTLAHDHLLLEGAAAVPLAALRQNRSTFRDQTNAAILCGANISPQTLKSLL